MRGSWEGAALTSQIRIAALLLITVDALSTWYVMLSCIVLVAVYMYRGPRRFVLTVWCTSSPENLWRILIMGKERPPQRVSEWRRSNLPCFNSIGFLLKHRILEP